MLKRFTLQQRIFTFTFLLILATHLLLWLMVRPQYRQSLYKERVTIVSQLQEYSLQAADRSIRNWFNLTNDLTDQIAEEPVSTESLLRTSIRFHPSLIRILITSEESEQEIDIRRNTYNDHNFSNPQDKWIRSGTEDPLFVNWRTDSTDQPSLFVVQKIFQVNNEPLRASLYFNASELTEDLFNIPVSGRHFESVMQDKGEVLVGQKSFSVSPELLNNTSYSRENIIQEGDIEWFLTISSMQTLPLWHVVGIDKAVILGPLQQLLWYSGLISLGVLGLMGGLSWYLSRRIEQPLANLIEDVEYMSKLDFEHRIGHPNLPEFRPMRDTLERIRLTLLRYQKLNVEKIILEQWKSKYLMTYSDDMIGITDEHGLFTFANNHLSDYIENMGLDPDSLTKKELLRQKNIKLADTNQTVHNPEPFSIRISKSEMIHTIDEGKVYYFDYQDVTILDETENPKGSLVVLHDITEERKLDQKRNEMINIIVHELKNPVTGIMGLTDILLEDPDIDKESRNTFLREINQSGKRVRELVNRFLDVQRLEADTMQIEDEPVDLSQVVNESIAALRPQLQKKNLTININKETEDTVMTGSRSLVFDAVQNIISNAIKYGDPDRTIEIDLYQADSTLTFAVTDHGYGISMEDQQKIFDKFYRVKSNEKSAKEKGTGLGLPYVKEIVNKHGGNISLKSNEQIGSRFILNFPVKKLNEA